MNIHDAHVLARILYFRDHPKRCPNYWAHTRGPDGDLAWHEWAEEKQKTHKQQQCPGCGLYSIWSPRRSGEPLMPDEFSEYDIAI